jgi:hypothetical protein
VHERAPTCAFCAFKNKVPFSDAMARTGAGGTWTTCHVGSMRGPRGAHVSGTFGSGLAGSFSVAESWRGVC